MSVRRAIAVAAAALALPAGGAAAPGGTAVYRGSSHGVTCVLRPTRAGATLTITFGPGTEAKLRRAAKGLYTMEFLMWPIPARGDTSGWATSYLAESVSVDVKRRKAQMSLSEIPKSTGFLCGVHEPVRSKGPDKASNYLRNPIVLVRLARS